MNGPNDDARDEIELERLGGPNVQEVHVDFLLEEEFRVGPNFLRSFIEAAAESFTKTAENSGLKSRLEFIEAAVKNGTQFQVESVRRSVSDQHGEADLIVVYNHLNAPPRRVAILIEDKIGAIFQPLQPERYRERGIFGENALGWNNHWTCLVAPKKYIDRGHRFDAAVELEQVKEWFISGDSIRSRFKAEVITQAITKAEVTGVKVVDEVMTNYRFAHYALFRQFFKDELEDVGLRPPGPTWKGDSWFDFRSRLLPRGTYINHKSGEGSVDLTFPNTRASSLKDIAPILETGMSIEQTHKSAAIRLTVAKIKHFECFDHERTNVTQAFSAVRRLLRFYVRESAHLQAIVERARTVAGAASI